MNEKRFIVIDDNFSRWVVDTSLKEDKHEGTLYKVYDMCNKLNELVEENEHLRQVNNDFEKLFSETISIADTSQLLETGNYDIKRMFVKELVDSLMSENEQLRNEVAHWKHRVFSLLWILGQFDKDKVKELLKEIDDE